MSNPNNTQPQNLGEKRVIEVTRKVKPPTKAQAVEQQSGLEEVKCEEKDCNFMAPNVERLNYHRNVVHNKGALEVAEQHPDNVGNTDPDMKCPECGTVWKATETEKLAQHRLEEHDIQQ